LKSTILVLGGDGYYGWPLAMKLAVQHPADRIIIVDNEWRRNTTRRLGFKSLVPIAKPAERIAAFAKVHGQNNITYIKADINTDELDNIIARELPHTICHLGQQASAPYSMKGVDEALFTVTNNEGGNMRLLWAVRKYVPDAHIIKIGSFGEYAKAGIDIPEGYFIPEHNGQKATKPMPYPREADDIYHISKINDTNYAAMACRKWHLRITDVMQSTIFGTRTAEMRDCKELYTRFDYDEIFGTVLNRFLAQVISGHPLTVYGTGNQRSGLMSLQDSINSLAKLVAHPADAGTHRVINNVGELNFSINEIAETVSTIAAELGYTVSAETHDPRHERPDSKPVYNIHTPHVDTHVERTPFADIVRNALQFLKQYKDTVSTNVFVPSINMTGNAKHGHHIAGGAATDKNDDRYWHSFREQHFATDRINLNPGTLGTTSAPVKKIRNNTQHADGYPLAMYEAGRVKNDEIHRLCNELWPAPAYELIVTHAISQTMNLLCLSMLRRFHQQGRGPYTVITSTHEHNGGIGAFHHLPEYKVYYLDDKTLADAELLKAAVDALQPHVAFISHVYYDTGNLSPLANFCGIVRQNAITCKIIIDAAQSLGVYEPPFSDHADVIVTSTHKWLYGPHGGGLTWMRHDFHQWIEGMYWNGNGVTNRHHTERLSLQGGHDFMLYAAIAESLELYKLIGKDVILNRSTKLARSFVRQLDSVLAKTNINYTFLNKDGGPIIALAFTHYDPYPLYKTMNERGIHVKCIKDHDVDDTTYHILRFGIPYYESEERLLDAVQEIEEFFVGV